MEENGFTAKSGERTGCNTGKSRTIGKSNYDEGFEGERWSTAN